MDRYRETIEAARRQDAVTLALKRAQRRMPKKRRSKLIERAITAPLGDGLCK